VVPRNGGKEVLVQPDTSDGTGVDQRHAPSARNDYKPIRCGTNACIGFFILWSTLKDSCSRIGRCPSTNVKIGRGRGLTKETFRAIIF